MPLTKAMPFWPREVIDEPQFLNLVGIKKFESNESDDSFSISGTLIWFKEIRVGLPGVDDLEVVFLCGGDATEVPFRAEILPEFSIDFPALNVALLFQSQFLRPVRNNSGEWVEITDDSGQPVPIELGLEAVGVHADLDANFEVSFPDGSLGLGLGAIQLGQTGLVLEVEDASLHFSRNQQQSSSAGQEGFRGIVIGAARLHLPKHFDIALDQIELDDVRIGTGGFGGAVRAVCEAEFDIQAGAFTGAGAGRLSGVPFALRSLEIAFEQNTIVSSKLEGCLLLPFFEQPIMCEIGIAENGDFTVALSASQNVPNGVPLPSSTTDGLLAFTAHELLEIKLRSFALRKEADDISFELGGGIRPLVAGLDWPEFDVKSLVVDSHGRVSIDGGWIDLPNQLTMSFFGFTLEVTKLGFGSEDDGTRWMGFSGTLVLCEGLPISGAVEGLKVNWKGSDVWLEFRGVALSFEIPNSLTFSGRVEFVNDPIGPKTGFKGGGKLTLIPAGMELDVQVVIGKNNKRPSFTFFYFFVDAQLPAGIPIFSTGIALYGIAGLYAQNMEPNKLPDQEWFDGWYKGPPPGVSSSAKWDDHRGSFALGAGVTLGTAPDNGYAVNGKTLLVIVLPGPVLMIEGKAGFLQERAKLSSDPPFKALVVLDGRAGELLINMEAKYPTPSDSIVANLIQITAGAEAFFDFHNWRNMHLFIGQRDPREKRIRAELLSLFEANAYFMLYATRFEVGAWIGYDRKWKFGPVKLRMASWMDGNALVSWAPVQFKGDLSAFMEFALKVFGVGLGLSAGAGVAVDVPTPYRVFAEVFLKVGLPWPIPDVDVELELEWKEEIPPPTPIPLGLIGVEHLKVSEKWELEKQPIYDTAGDGLWYDSFTVDTGSPTNEFGSPVVPLDSKVVVSFKRPMVDAALIGLNPTGVPLPERVGKFEFRYRLVEVKLEKRPKGSASDTWETVARRAEGSDEDQERLWGSWLAVTGDASAADSSLIPSMTKFMLFCKSPYEYARETTDDTYYDHFATWVPDYGMSVVVPPELQCLTFESLKDKKPNAGFTEELRIGDVIIIGENLWTQTYSNGSEQIALRFGDETELATVVVFPGKVRQLHLRVRAGSNAKATTYDGRDKVGEWRIDDIQRDVEKLIFPEDLTNDFDLLILEGHGQLSGLCYVTESEAQRFLEEQATAEHAESAGDAYGYPVESELLSADSFYRITVKTEAVRRQVGQGSWSPIQTFAESSYFQTMGPPGLSQGSEQGTMTPSGEGEHYPSRGPLRDLAAYIDQSRLTPSEGSQAVYRSYDIGVEFNEAYVEAMYLISGNPLAVYLYDSNGQGLRATDGGSQLVSSDWRDNQDQSSNARRADLEWQASVERAWTRNGESIEVLGGEELAREANHPAAHNKAPIISLENLPRRSGIWAGGTDFVLRPATMYRATVAAMTPKVVIPLDSEGQPIYIDEEVQYALHSDSDVSLADAIDDSCEQVEASVAVVSDGRRVALASASASDAAQPENIRYSAIEAAIAHILGAAEAEMAPKAVYSWSFVTSRFASFLHHIQSFVDGAWDLRQTQGDNAWSELSDEQRDLLKGSIEAAVTGATDVFELSADYFGVKDRPLPARLEFQVLEDPSGRYGFLIESPEPIAWRANGEGRVSIEVRKAEEAYGHTWSGLVKLIDCDLDGEWVELLVQESTDLTGYIVEKIQDPALDSLYFEFGPGSEYPAGTVIRIHSGVVTAASQHDVDRKHLFSGRTRDVLSNAGEILRVANRGGEEVHRRTFKPRTYSSTINHLIAADEDGTRSFLFLKDGDGNWIQDVEGGAYEISWRFRRNPGTHSELPILWRCGSTTDEVTKIEFSVPAALP